MRVVAEEPWSWILFEDSGSWFLDVLVEHGAVSFNVTAPLRENPMASCDGDGLRFLEGRASAMRRDALMQRWQQAPLPPGWAERSGAAVREWRKG